MLLAVVCLLIGVVFVVAVDERQPGSQEVYSVAQVAAGLAHHPASWVGRTWLVRGTVIDVLGIKLMNGHVHVLLMSPAVNLANATFAQHFYLWVAPFPPNSFGLVLQRLPLVGALFSQRQVLQEGTTATFRLTLLHHATCMQPAVVIDDTGLTCDDGLLDDGP
jgi:hypothetical protein